MTDELQQEELLPLGPGEKLRSERMAKGLSINEVAAKLFLKPSLIEALERDEHDPAVSLTFIRGYYRLYAKHLGLDPEAILADFNSHNPTEAPPAGLKSFSRRVARETDESRLMMVTYVIILVIIALAALWWYQRTDSLHSAQLLDTDLPLSASVSAPENSQPMAAAGQDQTEASPGDDHQAAEPLLQQQRAAQADDTALMPAAEAIDAMPREEAAANRPVQDQARPAPTEDDLAFAAAMEQQRAVVEIQFTFTGDCWVNVVDATGEAVAFGVKPKGRVMPVTGVPPFEVVLGAPGNVEINYAGKAVDISHFPVTRTARFQLPQQSS